MKNLVLILSITSFLYSASPELIDNNAEIALTETIDQPEIASLEITPKLQPSISQADIQMPAPPLVQRKKQPWIAVSLSALFPGLGHFYLEDTKTATGLMGTAGLSRGLMRSPHADESLLQMSASTLQATTFYSFYASYRDARLYNGSSHYSYPMPTDDLMTLTTASFKWSVLKKPEVWGGVLGALAIATATVHFAYPDGAKIETHRVSMGPMPVVALPVGIGEESFFRGFLQSALSETFNPATGIILSSLAFGAAHIPNARMIAKPDRWRYYTFSLPIITGLGAYCGWLTHKNHSLQESVAVHTWYDFILFSAAALASETAATGRPGFSLALPF